MVERSVRKGVRFDTFRRDGFTCQYCGRRPPDVTLQIDHIQPIAEGGDNEPMNLITACAACNAGKGKKLLEQPQRPDADLAWLEMQQEVAELRGYQEAKAERDLVRQEVLREVQDEWYGTTGLDWAPSISVLSHMLERNDIGDVAEASSITAWKIAERTISKKDWLRYMRGILRRMREER